MVSTGEILEDLRDTLGHAKMCHEIWWAFVGVRKDRESFISTALPYEEFFVPVQVACYCTFVQKLTTVFDSSNDSISLKKFFNRVRNECRSPDVKSNLKKIELELDSVWDAGSKLYKVRSKLIAHRSLKKFSTDYPKETGFVLNDLKSLLDSTIEVFGKIATQYNGSGDGLKDVTSLDALASIIESLKTPPSLAVPKL
jgi:hypothetical protein